MTQTTNEHVSSMNEYDESGSNPVPIELMPLVAEELAWHEEQLKTVPSDRLAIVRDDKERLIDRLLGDRPGETMINEVSYLSALYENRSAVMEFTDGSTLRSWGTRDRSNLYLDHRYYVQQRTDGELRYRVISLDDDGRTIYSLDDDGSMAVTMIGRSKHEYDFSPYRPRVLATEEGIHAATRSLFDSSLLAAAVVNGRTPEAARQADAAAHELLQFGPVEDKLKLAASQEDVDQIFAEFCGDRPVPYEMLQVSGLVTIE